MICPEVLNVLNLTNMYSFLDINVYYTFFLNNLLTLYDHVLYDSHIMTVKAMHSLSPVHSHVLDWYLFLCVQTDQQKS